MEHTWGCLLAGAERRGEGRGEAGAGNGCGWGRGWVSPPPRLLLGLTAAAWASWSSGRAAPGAPCAAWAGKLLGRVVLDAGSEKELWEQLSLARDMGVLTPEDEEAAAVLPAQGGDCTLLSVSREDHGCLWSCQWSMVSPSQHINVMRDSGAHSAQDPAGPGRRRSRAPQPANEFWAVLEHF